MSTPQHQMQQQAAPAPNWQGRPVLRTSYTSPIPVTRTHLGHALASEWTKIKSVRSTMWTLGVFVLLVVGIGFLVAAQTTNEDFTDVPYTIPAFFGLILGQICLITLGVLVVSSEYGTGMIRTTFTASPQRYRVLTAKLIIFFVVAFVVSALSIGVVGLSRRGCNGGSSDKRVGRDRPDGRAVRVAARRPRARRGLDAAALGRRDHRDARCGAGARDPARVPADVREHADDRREDAGVQRSERARPDLPARLPRTGTAAPSSFSSWV
jgi:hypothetical protein